tara:strand:- start:6947 stop:7366 length:420 start_codon:yes stop_codon:yes gene_type:complete
VSLFIDHIKKRLIEARGKGHTLEQCAALVGIAPRTLDYWIAKGRDGEQPYQAWYRQFQMARANMCTILLDSLFERAVSGDNGATYFLLERVHGFTKDGPPPIQISIDIDGAPNPREDLKIVNEQLKMLTTGPVIDLDED